MEKIDVSIVNVDVTVADRRGQPVPGLTIDNFADEMSLKEQTIYAHSSMRSVVDAARAFSSSEGRKIILLVTGYLPMGTASPINRGDRTAMNGSHIQDVTGANESATGPMTVTIPSVAPAKGSYRIVVAVRDELTDKVALAEHKVDV